ncbi:MAG: peptidylprolyl isomerase [Panacagrimonas sp.]
MLISAPSRKPWNPLPMLFFQTRQPSRNPTRPLATLACLLCVLLPASTHAEVLDRIVAIVNDGIVLQSDLDREIGYAIVQLRARDIEPPSDPSVLRSQVLEKLVVSRVQTQRAAQAGIRVDDRELNEVITGIAQQNKMNLAQFAEAIKDDGGDFLAIREQVRDEVTINRLRQREVDSRVVVTEQDINLFLAGQPEEDDTEYRLSHILVAIPDGATPEQREAAHKKADGLRQQLVDGGDFAALAVSSSDGQQSLQGGDLDWRKADVLPLIFLQAARKLKPGDNSPVLETAGGYHIIRLVETRNSEERKTVVETQSRHILLQANAIRTEDQARLQARDLHQQLSKEGVKEETFAKLAGEFSDDPGSKANGGDLGWQPPGLFAPEFQQELDALQPGQMSAPFRTQFGWHIAQVMDRRDRDITDESRRARARGAIRNRKAAEEYDTWLRRLRAEAYVEVRGIQTAAPAATPVVAPVAGPSEKAS